MIRPTALAVLLATVIATSGCATHRMTRSDRVAAVGFGAVLLGAGALVVTSHGDSYENPDRDPGTYDFGNVGSMVIALPLLALGAGALVGGLLAPSAPEPSTRGIPTLGAPGPSPASVSAPSAH